MNKELNEQQQQAVEITDSSLLIVAGAGTGKTRVIIEKIKKLLNENINSNELLALTFTNKAADEMKERLKENSNHLPFIGTFHSFCVTVLRKYGEEIDIKSNFMIADKDDSKRIIKSILKKLGITTISPKVIQTTIDNIKTEKIKEIQGEILKTSESVLDLYEKELEESNLLDFNDLILKTIDLLETSDKVRETLQKQYKYILIDEFQDTDRLQNSLIRLIVNKETKVIAVGDTDQTIYSWRGADINNMLDFEEVFTPAKLILLTQNYRSTKNILDAANSVIQKNKSRQEKELFTKKDSGELIRLASAYDEEEEARIITKLIKQDLNRGFNLNEIAVLYRANFQARAIEREMIISNIPYTVVGSRFFDRLEIKGLVAYLILTQNLNNKEAYKRASSIPRRKIGEKTIEKVFANQKDLLPPKSRQLILDFENDIKELKQILEENSIDFALSWLVQRLKYNDYLEKTFENPKERFQEVRELIAFSKRFSHLGGDEGVATLLAEVALGSDQDNLRHKNHGVKLMTIHSAKGLEFSSVYISGMEEGLFPLQTEEEMDEEEERRLCYVAITRAKIKLTCSSAKRRSIFGNFRDMRPSSFLNDIPPEICTTETIYTIQT